MAKSKQNEAVFEAEIKKIQTTIDGGWRITLDCDQSQANEILKLSNMRDRLASIAIVQGDDHGKW